MAKPAQTPARQREKMARQVSQWITILDSVAQTGKTPTGADPTPAQMRALELGLAKTLPNLQAQEIVTENKTQFVVTVPAEASRDEWQKMADKVGSTALAKDEAPEKAPEPEQKETRH